MIEADPLVALVTVLAVLVALPASAVLYEPLLVQELRRRSVPVTAAVAVLALLGWGVAVLALPEARSAGSWAVASLAAFAGVTSAWGMRESTASVLPVLAAVVSWGVLVFAPVALIVFVPGAGLFDGPVVDLGGVLPVHIAGGAAVLGVLAADRRRAPATHPPHAPRAASTILAAVMLWLAWGVVLAGLEFVIDDVTWRILLNVALAGPAGAATWLLVQHAREHRWSLHGATSGLVCGLVAVTPGCAFLDPGAAVVVTALATAVAALVVLPRARRSGRLAWFLVGSHLVAGAVGFIALGFAAVGIGFMYTGQPDILVAHLAAVLVVAAWSAALAGTAWVLARSLSARRRSPR